MNKKTIFIFIFTFINELRGIPTLENLHICTVASEFNKEAKQLYASCQHYGINIDILGCGPPFKWSSNTFTCHGRKLIEVKHYLDRFPNDDIVLFVDAYDVLFLADAQTILNRFLSKQTTCIFAAEHFKANSRPLHYLANFYPPSPTMFKYLNSGTYIGYVGCLKQMLNDFQICDFISDQGQLALYYIYHQNEISLDYQCDLCLPLIGVNSEDITLDEKNKSIYCLLTGSTPCIVHGTGGVEQKQFYQLIYDRLFAQSDSEPAP